MGVFFLLAMLGHGATRAIILKPVVNMRAAPAADSSVVSQAIYGTAVDVTEERGPWRQIRTPDAYTGWVEDSSLETWPASAPAYASGARVAEVESLFANLYREPDLTTHEPALVAPFETRLEVTAEPAGEDRRWIQVRLVDGRAAWVQRGDVAFHPPKQTVAESIATAKRFLGLPYLWGGVSSFGFDCSGFIQMIGRRRGLLLPRDAAPQARWNGSVPVRRGELEPGDLIYFGASAGKITHTGMYIGAGLFIHATAYQHPVVQISRLADEHWSRLFVAARRLK